MKTVSQERRNKIIAETTTLITAHYVQCRLWALWQILAPTDIGGYGLPLSLGTVVRRERAAALLENDNFTYAGGVSRLLCSIGPFFTPVLGGPRARNLKVLTPDNGPSEPTFFHGGN